VFANKCDLPGSLSAEEIKDVRVLYFKLITIKDVKLYTLALNICMWYQVLQLDEIKSHHWQIVGCSAVTGEHLLEGVDWVVNDIAARIFTLD
jgi:ADP-ribosylation factor-like protein 2